VYSVHKSGDAAKCGTSLLADPGFRHQAAEATGRSEADLEASMVADPHTTVDARYP